MARVPAAPRTDLTETQREAYAEIEATRGPVHPVFDALIDSPELAKRIANLGAYVRFEVPTPARQRHLVALVALRELDCQYAFTVHAVGAREHGVPPEAVAAIGRGDVPADLPELDALLVEFARQLTIRHRVDDDTFEAVLARLGRRGLTDLVGIIAYYSLLAYPLNAFDVAVRSDLSPELPDRPGHHR